MVAKGMHAVVVRGVKVPRGTTGVVIWSGDGKFGWRVGIKDAAGTVHFTSMGNVEPVGPPQPPTQPPPPAAPAAVLPFPSLPLFDEPTPGVSLAADARIAALEARVAALEAALAPLAMAA